MNFPAHFPVACHTDNITIGSTFVAIQGMNSDGALYIPRAIQLGATTIVVQNDCVLSDEIMCHIQQKHVALIRVPNTRKALAELSAKAYGNPAQKLKIIGITGTKGKTSSAFIIEHILRTAGVKTALLSTVHNTIATTIFPAPLTTPHPDYIHTFFSLCVGQGVEYVVMEAAAQAFSLYRLEGIEFDAALFTNFSLEHSEFYTTIDDYFAAKCRLFAQIKKNGVCVINSDEPALKKIMSQNSYTTFGMKSPADFVTRTISSTLAEHQLEIFTDARRYTIATSVLLGSFNAYNIAGAFALCIRLGISAATIVDAFSTFSGVPGRLQPHHLPNGALCFIDYAHNPSSYEAVLSTVRSMTSDLIVVFGCGGQRDPIKRPMMGTIATTIADKVILTTDNPRNEDPVKIIADIMRGVSAAHIHKVVSELDRESAIKRAYQLSSSGSIIMLLGKGPDEYQLQQGVKTQFSERKILETLDL